ncbi:MAG: 30S ribosomal protein S20 [Candidatus Levyibacteriota bacterium]
MPVIKSAKKKLRQDKKREKQNNDLRELLRIVMKAARKNPSDKTLQKAYSVADKATKKHLLHKNKAARMKSSLAKLLSGKAPKKTETKTTTAKAKKPAKSSKK